MKTRKKYGKLKPFDEVCAHVLEDDSYIGANRKQIFEKLDVEAEYLLQQWLNSGRTDFSI